MRLLISLELRRLANSLRHLVRSPLRLAGTLLLLCFIGPSLVSQLVVLLMPMSPRLEQLLQARLAPFLPHVGASLFGFLLFATYLVVSNGLEGRLLAFSPSDIDFLFPSPLPRRTVLLHRLVLDYLRLAATIGLFVLLLAGFVRFSAPLTAVAGLAAATAGLSLYLVTVLNLSHLTYLLVTFHANRFRHLPAVVKAMFGAVVVILALLARRSPDWWQGLGDALSSSVAWILMFPLVATWELLLAPLHGLPAHLGLKLGLLACGALLSLVALLARPENIYEPSLGASLLRAELRAAIRSGDHQRVAAVVAEGRRGRGPLRRVPLFGTGPWVMLWKGLATQLRSPGQAAALFFLASIVLPLLVVGLLRQLHHGLLLRQAPLLVVYLAWSTGVGLFRAQQAELRKVDVLKPLPVPAWSLVLAQTAPSILGWALGVSVGLGVLAWQAPEVDRGLCAAAALAVPGLMALISTSNLALAMIFPASTDPAQVALGQMMLLVCSGLIATPGVVVAAVLWMLKLSPLAVGLATGAVFAVVAVLCLVLAASLYRRFDPTD